MGGAVGVGVVPSGVARLLQRAVDKTVLGIHDGSLAVIAGLLFHTCGSLVSVAQYLCRIGERADVVFGIGIAFEQFDGQIACGVAVSQILGLLQMILYLVYAVLYLVSVVDVQMTVVRIIALGTLVHGDDSAEEFVHTPAVGEDCRHHRCAEEPAQRVAVYVVAPLLCLVVHVEGTDHADMHVYELCSEIEVALQVAGINDVDDHVGGLVYELPAYI